MKKVTKIAETASSKVKLKKIRVAAYCRVSTDSDAQLESLEAQKTHYENYITSRDDWEFAGLYYDEGITGTKKDKRPELLRLIDNCKAGKVDFVITKSISRFSRNTTDCLELVRKLLALHIPIYFEKENINTGSMESELFLAILSSMAEGESVSISENSKWSIQKRFESGTYKVSYPPYGYDWDGEQMIINPEQAAVVKEIFAALLSGKGTHAIADDLNRRGIPTKRNGRWTATTIRGMLSNEKYVGDCLFQKTYSDSRFVRHNNHGEQTQYMVKDHHEAIISREDFEAAHAFIHQRATEKGVVKGSDKYQNRYTFSGKIICADCGDIFGAKTWHSTDRYRRVIWQCNGKFKGERKCETPHLTEERLKELYLAALGEYLSDRDAAIDQLRYAQRMLTDTDFIDEDIQALEEELTTITGMLRLCIAENAANTMTEETYRTTHAELCNRFEGTEAKLAALQKQRDKMKADAITIGGMMFELGELDSLPVAFDEKLWHGTVDHITVHADERVVFHFKDGKEIVTRL